MNNNFTFAFTGPKSSGKTVYHTFLSSGYCGMPLLIHNCLRLKDPRFDVQKGNDDFVRSGDLLFLKKFPETVHIDKAKAMITFDNRKQSTLQADFHDFPGELFVRNNNQENREKLRDFKYILFFLPYWFVLPQKYLNQQAQEHYNLTRPSFLSWIEAFNAIFLPGSDGLNSNERKSHELIITLTMFGHHWASDWFEKTKFITDSEQEVFFAMESINNCISDLEVLENRITKWPWVDMTKYLSHMAQLQNAIHRYIEIAGHISKGSNNVAASLLKLSGKYLRKTYSAINVVDNCLINRNGQDYFLLGENGEEARLAHLPLMYLLHCFK